MEIISSAIKKVPVVQWLFILVLLFCLSRAASAQSSGPPAYPPGGPDRNILLFNGKNQSLDVTIPGFSGKSGTFETWVRVDWDFVQTEPVFSNNINTSNDNAFNIYIFYYSNYIQYGGTNQANNIYLDAGAEDWSGKFWRHIAITWQYDESTGLTEINAYINGQLQSSTDGAITINPGETFSIGSHRQQEYFGPGNLAEVRVWNVARTEAEISSSYQEILTGTEPGLLGYWRLDDASGSAAANKVSGGNATVLNDKFNTTASWQPAIPVDNNPGKFFGAVSSGGVYGRGGIFTTSPGIPEVNFTEQFTNSPDGSEYVTGALLEANGLLYGVTSSGGKLDGGIIFSFNPATSEYIVLHQFDNKAKKSFAGLAIGPDGKVYGTTREGGAFGEGVIFEFNLQTKEFKKRADFKQEIGTAANGTMLLATNNKFYGIAHTGGVNNIGTIYEFDPSTGALVNKVDFTGPNGYYSSAGMLYQHSNGKIYGTTARGGANDFGAFFEFDPVTGVYTKKGDFSDATGWWPVGGVFEAPNGKLYTFSLSNQADVGSLVEYDIDANTLTKKFTFDDGIITKPLSSMIFLPDGRGFAVGFNGGDNNRGSILEYDLNANIFTLKKSFDETVQGTYSTSGFTRASNGKLYGVTREGSLPVARGTIFQYDPDADELVVVKAFSETPSGENIISPQTALIQVSETKLYGASASGGQWGYGSLFEYDITAGEATYKASFNNDGANGGDVGSSLASVNGKVYGTTRSGAGNGAGGLFEYNITTAEYNVKFAFSAESGYSAFGTLVSVDDKLFGVCLAGGLNGSGVLYKYDISTSSYSVLYHFDNSNANPYDITYVNGKLYGVTQNGGASNTGILFEYDIASGTYQNLIDLPTYAAGSAGSIVHYNGKLYLTEGSSTAASLCEYELNTGLIKVLHQFNMDGYGSNPVGKILVTSDGKIYGVTSEGGHSNGGTIYQYDLATDSYDVKWNFAYSTGGYAPVGGLMFVEENQEITFNTINNKVFGADSFPLVAQATSSLPVTFESSNEAIAKISAGNVVITGVGTVTITAQQDGAFYYKPVEQSRSFTVSKAPLTITAKNKTRPYKETNPDLTVTYSGFVYGESASNITPPTLSVDATATSNAGTYPITLTGGEALNYDLTKVNGTLTISKVPLTITAENKSRPYKETNPDLTVTYSGFVYGESASNITPPTISVDATATSNAGTYPIMLTGGEALNYDLTKVNGTLTITKIDQTITFTSVPTKTIGNAPFSLEAISTSGLPVIFNTSKSLVTINGGTVTIVSPGSETIIASQSGDVNYNAAASMSHTFCINPTKPTLTEDFSNPSAPVLTSSANAGNQWFNDGVSVSGANSTTFTVSKAGQFTVQANVDGCISVMSDVAAIVVTGIFSESSIIKVFPNPAINSIEINLPEAGEKRIQIFSANGKVMDNSVTSDISATFDVNSYSTGVYLLKVQTNNGNQTIKFIKE